MNFKPKTLDLIGNYSAQSFSRDVIAGIIVGIVALPLAIAFGIASGVSPQNGLITAIIAGFIISLLGGSRVQIGGPTGAFIVIVFGIVQQYGIEGLFTATLMAGLIMIVLGLCKLGTWIKFIPTSVVTGFTSGIAVVIFSSQIPSLFGLKIDKVPADFISKWSVYFSHFSEINNFELYISLATILILVLCTRFLPKLPGAFFALIATTVASVYFELPVETIGSKFGEITMQLPRLGLPNLSFEYIRMLMPAAISIAALGAIESLLSAVVADGMIGGKHRSNTELIAQGIANIVSPIFGGIPATGAIARTATNVKNGGRSPIAGMVHAITLLLIILFFGKFAALIPMATLAGILVIVSYNMSEWRTFKGLFAAPKSDIAVLLLTFFLTVFFDLIIAIQVGMILSTFIFMKKMADASCICYFRSGKEKHESKDTYFNRPDALSHFDIPDHIEIYEIRGAFFFGAASKFETILLTKSTATDIVLRLNQLYTIDASGLKVLKRLSEELRSDGKRLYLTELNEHCLRAIHKTKGAIVKDENIFDSLKDVLETI